MSQKSLFADIANCPECNTDFERKAYHHVRCSNACRQKAWRDSKRAWKVCPGCGVNVTGRATFCGGTCQKRVKRWKTNGKSFACFNTDCPRTGINMVHRFDIEAGAWKCNGCGQLQWW